MDEKTFFDINPHPAMKNILPTLSLLLFFVFAATVARGQETRIPDIVYMRNGVMIKGFVVETIPNQSVRIVTPDGATQLLNMSDVDRIEKAQPFEAISVPPAAAQYLDQTQSQAQPAQQQAQQQTQWQAPPPQAVQTQPARPQQQSQFQAQPQQQAQPAPTRRYIYVMNPGFVRKDPGLATIYSLICPGLGQFYNEQFGKGAIMLGGCVAGMVMLAAGTPNDSRYNNNYQSNNGSSGLATVGAVCAVGFYLWSVIDAPIQANNFNRRNGAWVPLGSGKYLDFSPDLQLASRRGAATAACGVRASINF